MRVDSIYGPIEAYDDDLITQQIRDFGNHTRPEFAFATSLLNLGDTLFDLGAHIGTFTLAASRRVGASGRILAVEGNPQSYALLCRNLQRLAPETTEARLCFVGGGERGLGYCPEPGNSGASYLAPGAGEIALESLDALVAASFEPGFIKIDVEGFESSVLQASTFVRDRRPTLYIEVSDRALLRAGSSAAALQDLLTGLGYAFFRNGAKRNWRSDLYRVQRLQHFGGGRLFDVLCVQQGSDACGMLEAVACPAPD